MESGHEAHAIRCAEAAYAYCGGEFVAAAAEYAALVQEGCMAAAMGLGQMYLRVGELNRTSRRGWICFAVPPPRA